MYDYCKHALLEYVGCELCTKSTLHIHDTHNIPRRLRREAALWIPLLLDFQISALSVDRIDRSHVKLIAVLRNSKVCAKYIYIVNNGICCFVSQDHLRAIGRGEHRWFYYCYYLVLL